VRIAGLVGWKGAQTLSFAATVIAWLYWRIFFFPLYVLWTIAVESKSLVYPSSCSAGSCSWAEVPERVPFLGLLGTLAALNYIWFAMLIKRGLRTLGAGGRREECP